MTVMKRRSTATNSTLSIECNINNKNTPMFMCSSHEEANNQIGNNNNSNNNNKRNEVKQTMGLLLKLRNHQLLFFASLLFISYSEAFAASTFSPSPSSPYQSYNKIHNRVGVSGVRGGSLSSSTTEIQEEDGEPMAINKSKINLVRGFGSTFLPPTNGANGANGANGKGKGKDYRNGASASARAKNSNKIQMPPPEDRILPCHYIAETNLPTDVGQFRLRAYRIDDLDHETLVRNKFVGSEPCVIYSADKSPFIDGNGEGLKEVPVRIHDQCFTSEVFRSQRCDCKEQLKLALEYIQENGGAIIYLQQEGRGIGIANKIAAYSLQDHGLDTVDANTHLGFPEDARQYGVVPSILEDMGIESIKLMTNNPRKIDRLKSLGIDIVDTVPMVVKTNKYNRKYIQTKVDRMNHRNFGEMISLGNSDETLRELISESVEKLKTNNSVSLAENYINDGEEMAAAAITTALLDDEDTDSDIELYTTEAGVKAADDGYCFGRKSVEDAIAAVGRGELVVVVDDMDRENEGDFIMAADMATPETIATIVRYSSGVICIGMEGDRMDELKLPAMLENNEDPKGTAFSVTVDASKEHGITTGISSTDRAKTMQLLADPSSTSTDFSRPGHIFPLRAKSGGVLERDGHTEAAVDLSRLAGRHSSGVLCEIVSEENPTEMMRLPELRRFCKKHGYVLTSIVDLAQYRRDTEENDQ